MNFTGHSPFGMLCLFVVATTSAWAADGPESLRPLRSIDAIRKLSYEEARMAPPVILRVTVTSHLSAGFDGQDNTGGMFFEVSGDQIPRLSESVEIYGNVTGGFYGPYVVVDEIKRHGGTGMPRPLNFRPDFIQTGIGDNRWIEIEGLLVSVDFDEEFRSAGQGLLVTGENDLTIRFRNQQSEFDVKRLERMVGSWVKLRGTGAPLFNDRRQRIGSDIVCSSHKNVELVEQQKKIPEVTLDEIGRWDSKRTKPGLVQTVAKVTLVEDARTLVAQSGEFGARVQTLQPHEVTLGDEIVFTGLPKTEGFFVGLRYASLAAAEEQTDPVEAIADPDPFSRSQAMRLVKVKGRLIEQQGRLLSLQLEEQILPVRLPKELEAESLPTIGSEIEVTGVKLVDADERGQLRSVTLAARSGADIDILQIPSWWTPQRYFIAILALLAVFILSLFWTLALKRRVEKQTALIESQLVSNAALEERNRIARELHDTLSQGFSGVGYQLASVKNHIESDPEKAKDKLDLARQMVEHSLAEARDSLSGLRIPAAADSLNFPDTTIAIARERCEEAELRLIVHHTLGAERLTLDAETAYACHRILLEAVMNAIRHSGGDSIGIATGKTDEELVFCVSDNGHGFDPAIKPAGHFGILGMQERAKEIEAALSVETSDEGTRLNLTLPISLS
ncbi:sensor histidine kinase [Verrucomicrobiales bacterium]|jgi:signal transduction histidine kinase|nr:sensor histidine kinase [Verrucomicrobiales bacterium]